ncbi:CU044_5270 family protein [Spirillospora sp. NPDC052242]
MNDIDALREAWDEPAAPSPAARAGARAALMDRTAGRATAAAPRRAPRAGRLPRLGMRLAAVGALATAAVVGVTVLQSGGGVDEHGRPAPVVPGIPAGPVANASELLERAAKSAETRAFTPPRPDQWIYVESRSRRGDTPNGPLSDDPADTRTNRTWTRADGTVMAYMEDGRLERSAMMPATSPPSDYASLAKLPTDPDALLKWIYADMGGLGETAEGRHSTAYSMLGAILRNNVLPPKLEAAVFRAIKQIPDVTLVEGRVDMSGRQAIALGRITEGYIHEEILFDPKTYAYLGERAVAIRDHSTRGEDGTLSFREGDLMRLTVQVQTGIVDDAGQRP